jgi:protein-tyrosine phosphatase
MLMPTKSPLKPHPIRIVFVCLGNICRSPMAEAVFAHLVAQAGLSDRFQIDSAGTGAWHVGEPAHRGTRRVLAEHGIESRSTARQVNQADLTEADYLIAMDSDNLYDLKSLGTRVGLNGRARRLLEFAQGVTVKDVPDPYYQGNFEEVYRLVEAGCQGLLAHIRREHNL